MQNGVNKQTAENIFLISFWQALGNEGVSLPTTVFTQAGALPSCFPVTDLAAASIASAGASLALLRQALYGKISTVNVDRRLSSFWFASSLRPQGWQVPPAWDAIAGDYATKDGWIRLHTNAPHHRAAAEAVLSERSGTRHAVARAVTQWSATELETAIVAAKGCAAAMRSAAAWRTHPQGAAVAQEPLIAWTSFASKTVSITHWKARENRPLHGLRVLDLTRILAGPTATRLLAGYGAQVLRIDPPTWEEPTVQAEVTLGKRCARLDLQAPGDRAVFEQLLSEADVLVHGYRADALERLGYGESARRALAPQLVDVSLSAYGWSGPWAQRRGFDSLVQMSSGIAEASMHWRPTDKPHPLPVQALDYATGYLIAAAVLQGLTRRLRGEGGSSARLSLARTAHSLLVPELSAPPSLAFAAETAADLNPIIENTVWGAAQRLLPPLQVDGAPLRWARPGCPLGSAEPKWLLE